MTKITPSIPKGSRDFNAETLYKRQFILNTIQATYELFGFEPIETPTMEKLDILTGKYGEEGDKLLFKVLNSGDYLAKANAEAIDARNSAKATRSISEKGLRYDLTVPFARYVAQHRNDITFPFKRYQMQPVWRADRPQKGRYREFYQCDADVIGTNSLIAEFEFLQIYDHVFRKLGIRGYEIKLNNRKILAGIAEAIGTSEKFTDLTVAIDKLDKVGVEGVQKELANRGFDPTQQDAISQILGITGCNEDRLKAIEALIGDTEIGQQGIAEMRELLELLEAVTVNKDKIGVDITLARGLTYYTGTIFEVKVPESGIGSISGGGRYDDLTSMFGLNDVSGVGISFGLDRIYDVMEILSLWPERLKRRSPTKILVTYMDDAVKSNVIDFMEKLRFNGINAEMYLEKTKLGKQFKYANDKGIPIVVVIGSEEVSKGKFQMKFMESGQQQELEPAYIINALKRL